MITHSSNGSLQLMSVKERKRKTKGETIKTHIILVIKKIIFFWVWGWLPRNFSINPDSTVKVFPKSNLKLIWNVDPPSSLEFKLWKSDSLSRQTLTYITASGKKTMFQKREYMISSRRGLYKWDISETMIYLLWQIWVLSLLHSYRSSVLALWKRFWIEVARHLESSSWWLLMERKASNDNATELFRESICRVFQCHF